jgi:hypothetical protein
MSLLEIKNGIMIYYRNGYIEIVEVVNGVHTMRLQEFIGPYALKPPEINTKLYEVLDNWKENRP